MKKTVLFVAAALVAMFVLSLLPNSAQARRVVVPTPTAGPIVSAN